MTSDSPTIKYGVPTVDGLQEPPEIYVPGFSAKMNLPEELAQSQDVLAFLRLGVTQWSRIAAWTWCKKYYAFEGTQLKDKEVRLKKTLVSLLTHQSINADGYLNYGGLSSKKPANDNSIAIVNQLLGNNLNLWKSNDKKTPIIDWTTINRSDIYLDDTNIEDLNLTLSDVLIKTTGQPLVTSVPPNKAFVKMFYVQITRDSFTGRVVRASTNENLHPKYTDTWGAKYINIIAYPPCPETFIDLLEPGDDGYTDDFKDRDSLLEAWASGKKFGDYLPPSAYIPIATT